jgi:hypothetical protein
MGVKTEFYADLKPEGKFKKKLHRIKLYNLEKLFFQKNRLSLGKKHLFRFNFFPVKFF